MATMSQSQIEALFADPANKDALQKALASGIVGATNTAGAANASNQVQAGQQSGAFQTTGQENQSTAQQQTQQQTGTQVGQTAQQQTGQTGVVDTLGMGSMLQGQQGAATANTNASNGFLSGVIQHGDPALQSKVQQAVNNATSGPGMVGAGQSANARAAGYAGAEVGRQAQAQQLQAAAQLAGPTAATTLASASTPFLGTTTNGTTTGSNATTSDTSSLGNTLGSMVNNQSQSGTSSADSSQVAAGTTPVAQNQSKGGSVICTVLVSQGKLDQRLVQRAVRNLQLNGDKYHRATVGYFFFGVAFAKWLLKHPRFAFLFKRIAWNCDYELIRRCEGTWRFNAEAWVDFMLFYHFTDKLGWFLLKYWPSKAQNKVTDPELVALFQKYDIGL